MPKYSEQLQLRRNNFYRDNYRRVLRLVVLLLCTAIILSAYLFYGEIYRKNPNYYASTSSGSVIPMHSLLEPVVTNKFILSWASTVARSVYNLDFVHWKQQLQLSKPYFSDSAWDAFQSSWQSSVIGSLTSNKLQTSAVVYRPPVIVTTGVLNGRFNWSIQVPLLVTYQSASETKKRKVLVTMRVSRVPTLTTPHGIQVTGFVVTDVLEGGS